MGAKAPVPTRSFKLTQFGLKVCIKVEVLNYFLRKYDIGTVVTFCQRAKNAISRTLVVKKLENKQNLHVFLNTLLYLVFLFKRTCLLELEG